MRSCPVYSRREVLAALLARVTRRGVCAAADLGDSAERPRRSRQACTTTQPNSPPEPPRSAWPSHLIYLPAPFHSTPIRLGLGSATDIRTRGPNHNGRPGNPWPNRTSRASFWSGKVKPSPSLMAVSCCRCRTRGTAVGRHSSRRPHTCERADGHAGERVETSPASIRRRPAGAVAAQATTGRRVVLGLCQITRLSPGSPAESASWGNAIPTEYLRASGNTAPRSPCWAVGY